MRALCVTLCSIALALCIQGVNAQSCQQICSEAYAFARQSRGDLAFIQQMQQLSNACQSCQLQERVRPQFSAPVPSTPQMPQWEPPAQTEQEKAIGKAMMDVDERVGNWAMRGEVLPKNVPLSSGTVKQETYTPPGDYVDPFQKHVIVPQDLSLMKPQTQAAPAGPESVATPTFVNPKNCTFNVADCQ